MWQFNQLINYHRKEAKKKKKLNSHKATCGVILQCWLPNTDPAAAIRVYVRCRDGVNTERKLEPTTNFYICSGNRGALEN